MDRYAVIMAGGGGTRLWPLSTREHPKHFLKLSGDKTMYEHAIHRLLPIFALDHILVVTVKDQAKQLQSLYEAIPAENYLIEPEPRGTAAVVGLAASHIARRDPEAIMVVLTSDHLITDEEKFLQVLKAGSQAAENGGLYTLGIQPSYPATGYGYIEVGSPEQTIGGIDIFSALKFKEKPDLEAAQKFIESGTHFWNSGMFIWRVGDILEEIKKWMPDLHQALLEISEGKHGNMSKVWATIKPQTIDYGIMEKADNIHVIPAHGLGWNDVGSWLSLFDYLETDACGNIVLGGEVIWQESKGSLVVEEDKSKVVACIGLKDLVIIDTRKALLVCSKETVQKVKEIVAILKDGGKEHYY